MTTPLTKLIAENKERPIAEAPRDGTMVLLYNGDTIAWNQPIGGHWCGKCNGWACEWNCSPLYDTQTHFRPLPDDRLALVTEVLFSKIQSLAQCHLHHYGVEDYELEKVIQQAEAIAEGKE